MPTYPHLQEVKKAESLPAAEGEKIGVCLTCAYWKAPTPPTRSADHSSWRFASSRA